MTPWEELADSGLQTEQIDSSARSFRPAPNVNASHYQIGGEDDFGMRLLITVLWLIPVMAVIALVIMALLAFLARLL
jgi:hypothetical protein